METTPGTGEATRREERRRLRRRWEDLSAWPLAILGVAFIAAFMFLTIDETPGSTLRALATVALAASWVGIVVDGLVRLLLTPRGERRRYLGHHVLDVLSVLLPLFRAVKVVQLLNRIPALRRRTASAVRVSVIVTGAAYIVVFVTFVALGALQVERGAPGATIVSFGDAMWWAIVTLTTVGYGDFVPVTIAGRGYAVALMLGGIVIVGSISALMVSYLTERIKRVVDAPAAPAGPALGSEILSDAPAGDPADGTAAAGSPVPPGGRAV